MAPSSPWFRSGWFFIAEILYALRSIWTVIGSSSSSPSTSHASLYFMAPGGGGGGGERGGSRHRFVRRLVSGVSGGVVLAGSAAKEGRRRERAAPPRMGPRSEDDGREARLLLDFVRPRSWRWGELAAVRGRCAPTEHPTKTM